MPTEPFHIDVFQSVLDDLRDRLARTRWLDGVEGAGWDYGTDQIYLRELLDHWQHGFDWRAQETMLNGFQQFRADLDGFGLHFIHERGVGPRPLPLLLSHGWPDSFWRFYKLIPMLTDPARFGADPEDAFDMVVPSIPGYGFSDRPRERGFTSARTADLFARLMTEVLGYGRFGAHGGDIGRGITEALARQRGDALVGIHLTDVWFGRLLSSPPADLSAAERAYLEAGQRWQLQEGAYALEQGTRPQTLAAGLNDSPAGLAAWLVEKFRAWSDCGGDVERRFSKDELLTNLTIYWTTQTVFSSFLPYYENGRATGRASAGRIGVPTGVALFPHDLVPAPREYAERIYNLQRWTEMPRGGHFAALEEPELLAEDLRAFFRPYRAAR